MIFAAGPAASNAAVRAALRPFGDAFPPQNIRHHFAGQDDDRGVYAKELLIPAGWMLRSHSHTYDHLGILSQGIAHLRIGENTRIVIGPEAILIPKQEEHTLRAITDVTWFCVHPTSETDADKVDQVILMSGTMPATQE